MIENNRVIKVNRSYWEIVQNGSVVRGVINNSYKGQMMPAVGDFVVTEKIDEGRVLILDLKPRMNELVKDYDEKNLRFTKLVNSGRQVVAANINKIFIVTSLNKDFHMGKLERFLILSDIKKAERIVVLSKADVCDDVEKYLKELNQRFPKIKTIVTSGKTGEGLDLLLEEWKSGETAVFIGSSGVGKSTLVNTLIGQEITKTNDVRARDDRGRHTTSASTLFEVVGGRYIIDTPGVREVGLASVSDEELSEIFALIEDSAKECKKYKCTHTKEDGCAVKQAVAGGMIDKKILERYIKLNNAKLSRKKNASQKSLKDVSKAKLKRNYKRKKLSDEEYF